MDGRPRVWTEVATGGDSQIRGLMFRESLPVDRGMLFVFGADFRGAFHMVNTLIPLSVAFIRHDGTILEIHDMAPIVGRADPSMSYRFALETNQGWFVANRVAVGDRAIISMEP